MASVILVDSCVFIGLLREGRDPGEELVRRAGGVDLATCGMVQLEVQRGVRGERVRQRLKEFMGVMRQIPTDSRVWEDATDLAWELGATGWTLPAQDLLIAACARRIGAGVLSFDRHFLAVPRLSVLRTLEGLGALGGDADRETAPSVRAGARPGAKGTRADRGPEA